jgi:hypothetical protein
MAKIPLEELRKRQKAALGKNGDGTPKGAPFSGKAPATEEPVVDDQATTNELPLKPAPAPVSPARPAVKPRSPDDTKTTLEMDLNQQKDLAARSASDEPPAQEVAPVVLPPAPRVPAVVRREPARAVAIPDPEEKPAEEAKPPDKKDIVKEVVEMLKPHIAKLLGEKVGEAEGRLNGKITEVSGRMDGLEGNLADVSGNIDSIVMELDGSEGTDDVVDTDAEGKVTETRPSIRKALRELTGKADGLETGVGELKGRMDDSESNVANIVTELMGTDGKEGYILEETDGKPQTRPSVWTAIAEVRGENDHAASTLRGLLGKNYGRLHAIVVSHEIQTRKLLVKALRDSDYSDKVKQVAIEQDPETAKTILEAFADKSIVRLSLAQEQKSSIEKLDDPNLLKDPQVKKLHDWVDKVTPTVVERAQECLDNINWEECEAANHRMIFGGDE